MNMWSDADLKEYADEFPTRDDVIQLVADKMFSDRVLNNSHRGDMVEMMVLSALAPEWEFVGLGWTRGTCSEAQALKGSAFK